MDNLSRPSAIKRMLRSKGFTLFILLIVLIGVFTVIASFTGAKFLSMRVLTSVLQDLAVPAFLAIGAGCLILSGGIDISVSAVGAMSGILLAVGVSWWGLPWYVAVLITLLFAAVVGLLNAVFINELGMQPFIATMAMNAIVKALMLMVSTNKEDGVMYSSINFVCEPLKKVINAKIGQLPVTVIILVAAFVAYGIMLKCTKFGREIYMLGGNRTCAKLCGVNARKVSYILYINCSVLGAISGIIYSSRAMQGSFQALSGDQFTGMTAAVLGGISFMGGTGGMGGAFIGLLVLKTFNKGMMICGSSTYLTAVLSGVLLLFALALDFFSLRRQAKRLTV